GLALPDESHFWPEGAQGDAENVEPAPPIVPPVKPAPSAPPPPALSKAEQPVAPAPSLARPVERAPETSTPVQARAPLQAMPAMEPAPKMESLGQPATVLQMSRSPIRSEPPVPISAVDSLSGLERLLR